MASGGTMSFEELATLIDEPTQTGEISFDYRALIDLAYFLAGSATSTDELEFSLRAFDFAEKFRDREPSRFHQRVMTNLYLQFGFPEKALALSEASTKAGPIQKWAVRLYAEHPRFGVSAEQWLDVLNWPLRNSQLAPMVFMAAGVFNYDNISVDPSLTPAASVEGPLVSVIMSVYRPTPALDLAIAAVINQTWANIELIVVDDGGDPSDSALIRAACEKDSRIRYLRAESNGGTYRCRNLALTIAKGKYIGFQDADDWTHPQRFETQINELETHPNLVATWCTGIQLTDNLEVSKVSRSGYSEIFASLVFRRETVLSRIGNFDEVRKSADAEFVRRIKTVFGDDSVRIIELPMYLHRVGSESLSQGDFHLGWWDFGRWAYRNAYLDWHETYGARIKPINGRKPFYAPPEFDQIKRFDVDIAFLGEVQDPGLAASVAELSSNQTSALVQGESLWRPSSNRKDISRDIWPQVRKPNVDLASLNHDFGAKALVVFEPEILNWQPALTDGHMRTDAIVMSATHAPHDDKTNSFRYEPSRIDDYCREVFGVTPLWVPRTETIRSQLTQAGSQTHDAQLMLASPVVARMRHRGSGRPVIGFWDKVDAVSARALHAAGFDVRVLRGNKSTQLLDHVQRLSSISLLGFLDQLDIAVFPAPSTLPNAPWHAAARGVVTVIHGEFDADADSPFVITHDERVESVVSRLLPDLQSLQKQSWLWATTSISPEVFRVSMNSILQKGHS